MAKYPLLQ